MERNVFTYQHFNNFHQRYEADYLCLKVQLIQIHLQKEISNVLYFLDIFRLIMSKFLKKTERK